MQNINIKNRHTVKHIWITDTSGAHIYLLYTSQFAISFFGELASIYMSPLHFIPTSLPWNFGWLKNNITKAFIVISMEMQAQACSNTNTAWTYDQRKSQRKFIIWTKAWEVNIYFHGWFNVPYYNYFFYLYTLFWNRVNKLHYENNICKRNVYII